MRDVRIASDRPSESGLRRFNSWSAHPDELLQCALRDWLVIAAAWYLMSTMNSIMVTGAGMVVVASRLHALGAILHDACHVDIRVKTFRWWLLEATSGWPISSTIEAMRYHHLRHHRFTGTARDPYLPPRLGQRPMPGLLLYLRGLLLPLWWTARPVVGVSALFIPQLQSAYATLFLQDRSGQDVTGSAEVVKCAKSDIAQLGAQLVVLGFVVVWHVPVLTTFIIPLHIAAVLNARRIVLEHPTDTLGMGGSEAVSRHHHENDTISSDAGLWGNWLLLPHNLGLHCEHHRYPTVAFRHLPKVRQALRLKAAVTD